MEFQNYVDLHSNVLKALDKSNLARFISGLASLRESGGTLWVAGNGGSSATASHTVADLTKTSTHGGKSSIRAIAISELVSLQTALANDINFESAIGKTLELMAVPGDALLVISVSGLSPNLVEGVEAARNLGLEVYCLVGQRGKGLASKSTYGIVVESDDYQIVENAHMMLIHWFVKELI